MVLCLLMLVMLHRASVAQAVEQNYALAFRAVASTLQQCGVALGSHKIEAACTTLNQHNALFRKLAFEVFCCIKKQLWAAYDLCEGLDYNMVEENVGHWERKIRLVEVKDFVKSQVNLMSFCLHYIRLNHENIQLGEMKKLEEAVTKAQADISSSMSITARLGEKRLEASATLNRIKSQTVAAESGLRQFQLSQRKVRKMLKPTNPNDHYSSTATFETVFPLLLHYSVALLLGPFGVLIIHRLLSPIHELLLTISDTINASPLNQALPEGNSRPIKHF